MRVHILKNNHGQGTAVEYTILFFIVVAVVVGMTTYMKRAVQGRIYDARNYMYAHVNGTYRAMHGDRVLPVGYEPYYQHTRTDKDEMTSVSQQDTPWAGHEGRFESNTNSVASSTTFSNILSAVHAP